MKDWFIQILENPDKDLYLLEMAGITTDNTQLLSKDVYKKDPSIKSLFEDSQGNFNNDLFESTYQEAVDKWDQFLEREFPKGPAFSMFDTRVTENSRIKNPNFIIEKDVDIYGNPGNPDRVKKGIEGFNVVSKKTQTAAEIALSQKIFDTLTGAFKEDTPENYALFKNPLKWAEQLINNFNGEALVLATYDEDEVDEYGVLHYKGEYKYNDDGTYYYETLNGRSPVGKLVLSLADILTLENSALNKIDFFDSDDLQKSISGTIAKNIALLTPVFIGGPVASVYYTAIIAKELLKTLPMIASVYSTIDNDYETPEWMNNLAATGESLSTSVSQYSKENVFTVENIANLLTDVALLWGLQKQIAKAVSYFNDRSALNKIDDEAFALYKSKKELSLFKSLAAESDANWKSSLLGQLSIKQVSEPVMESFKKRLRFGADVSLLYMSLISNYDVYNTMLDRGASLREAWLVSLGSTVGMFGVDRYLGLGEMFFDDLTDDAIKSVRGVMKKEYDEVISKTYGLSIQESEKKLFKRGLDLGKKVVTKFQEGIKDHSLNILGKAIGEGLEEVSEEFVTDMSKQLYDFGVYNFAFENGKTIDSAGAWENALERYAMSFLGGTLGGGLFGIINKSPNTKRDWDIIDLVKEGYGDALRKQVKEDIEKGSIGNTKLSGTIYTKNSDGKLTYLSTSNKEDSLNDVIGLMVIDKINSIEATLIRSGANLSKDLLFENMVFNEARYRVFKNASYITGYYDEYNKRLKTWFDNLVEYEKAVKTRTGNPNDTKIPTDEELRNLTPEELTLKEESLKKLKDKVDVSKKEFDNFLSGDVSLWYTRKLLFALDPNLYSAFFDDLDYTSWLLNRILGGSLDEANLSKEWVEHVQKTMATGLDDAFNAYLKLESILTPDLFKHLDLAIPYKKVSKTLEEIFKMDENNPFDFNNYLELHPLIKDLGTKLSWYEDGKYIEEDESSFANWIRISENTELSDAEKSEYTNQRLEKIKTANDSRIQGYLDLFTNLFELIDYKVDANTKRRLLQVIGNSVTSAMLDVIETISFLNGSFTTLWSDDAKKILSSLLIEKTDTGIMILNEDQVLNSLEPIILRQINSKYELLRKELSDRIGLVNIRSYLKQVFLEFNLSDELVESIIEILSGTGNKVQLIAQFLAKEEESVDDVTQKIKTTYHQKLKKYTKLFKNDGINDWYTLLETLFSPEYLEGTDITSGLNELFQHPMFLTLMPLFNRNAVDKYLSEKGLSKNTKIKIFDTLLGLNVLVFDEMEDEYIPTPTSLVDLASNDLVNLYLLGEDEQEQIQTILNNFHTTIQHILKHPISDFWKKINTTLTSPLLNVFNTISLNITVGDVEFNNINILLEALYNSFVKENALGKFRVNDTLLKQLHSALKVLNLTKAYIYSISNPFVSKNYFGHTSLLNEFAKNHLDKLSKPWEMLPEIPNDYGKVLEIEADNLENEISNWLIISQNIEMNKKARLVNTEKLYYKLTANLIKELGLTFTIDDKQYDLKEGVENFRDDPTLSEIAKAELSIYNNYVNMLNSSSITEELFFENLFEKIITDKNSVKNQYIGGLDEHTTKFSAYYKVLYVISLLSESPKHYYESLKNFISDYLDIAPLTIQLIGARIALSAASKTFKTAFKKLGSFLQIDGLNYLSNLVHIDGIAGAGKTTAVLLKAKHNSEKEGVILIGPTKSQAIKLQEVLGEKESYTFSDNQIFNEMVPNYTNLESLFQTILSKAKLAVKDKLFTSLTFSENNVVGTLVFNSNGFYNINWKFKNISFNPKFTQKHIFIDEAAHLTSFQLSLLNQYCELNGGTIYAANDSCLLGYDNDPVANLGIDNTFCIRTPRQVESLRTSNILKQSNHQMLDAIIDTFNKLSIIDPKKAKDYLASLLSTISLIHLRVYNKEEVNGELLGAQESDFKKLPRNKKLGFIGKKDSLLYSKLKELGFTDIEVLSPDITPGEKFMLGQEFDFVIVDKLDNTPKDINNYAGLLFIKKINTLATRSKVATLFIDKFNNIFGSLQVDDFPSIGFSIKDLVENFRLSFLTELEKINLNSVDKQEEENQKDANSEEVAEIEDTNDILNFVDNSDDNLIQSFLNNLSEEVKKVVNDSNEDPLEIGVSSDPLLMLTIEANTVVPVIGLPVNDDDSWKGSSEPSSGEIRRNASAFYFSSENISKYVKKEEIQRSLSAISSYILYGGSDLNIPPIVKEGIINAKLYLEFREKTDLDHLGINNGGLENTFIQIGGKSYVISIVAEIPLKYNKPGNISPEEFIGRFDVCLLNDPKTLNDEDKQTEIVLNLKNKLSSGKISEENKATVLHFVDNIEDYAKEWQTFVETVINKELSSKLNFEIELSNEDYHSHKMSSIKNSGLVRRLGGDFSIADVENTGEAKRNTNNFRNDMTSRKVTSPVYLIGPKNELMQETLSKDVLGRAVVFASGNTNLTPDELAKKWYELKLNPDVHTPEVRAFVLRNHGVSFAELIQKRVQKITGQKPHKMKIIGVKMFAALWNARINLSKLLNAISNLGWNEEKLIRIASSEKHLYDAKSKETNLGIKNKSLIDYINDLTEEDFKRVINNNESTKEEVIKFINFNEEDCKDIPFFRIGYSTTDLGFVRPYKVDKSFYPKAKRDEVNLFAIHPNKVGKMYNIINDTIAALTSDIKGVDGNKFPMFKLYHKNGKEFDEKEYLLNSLRGLAGIVKSSETGLTIKTGDEELDVKNEFFSSFIPKALIQIGKAINYAKNNEDLEFTTLHTIDRDNNKHLYALDFSKIALSINADSDYFKIMSVIFHGTTESIEPETPLRGKPAPKRKPYVYEAPFKNGFYINPLIYVDKDNLMDINIGGDDGKSWALLKVETSDVFFDVAGELRPGGMSINMGRVMYKYDPNTYSHYNSAFSNNEIQDIVLDEDNLDDKDELKILNNIAKFFTNETTLLDKSKEYIMKKLSLSSIKVNGNKIIGEKDNQPVEISFNSLTKELGYQVIAPQTDSVQIGEDILLEIKAYINDTYPGLGELLGEINSKDDMMSFLDLLMDKLEVDGYDLKLADYLSKLNNC